MKTTWRLFYRGDAPAWLVLGLAGAGAIYPVLAAPLQRVIGYAGDNLQYLYILGWIAKALRTGGSLLVDPRLNFPAGLDLASTDSPLLSFFITAPLTWLFNEALTYNLLLFLSYFLSGLFTYLWLKRLTRNRFAALIGGLIFLLAPYRMAHGYGHLNLVSTQFFPLFFWALDTALTRPRPTLKELLWLGLATFLVGAMSMYYLVICLSCAIVYTPARILTRDASRDLRDLTGFKNLSGLWQSWKYALSALTGGLLSALPYLNVWLKGGFRENKLELSRGGSAGLVDFFLPATFHPLWGKLSLKIDPGLVGGWIEFTIYIGLAALALALIGLAWRDNPARAQRVAWLASGLFAFMMALGTDLHLLTGQPLAPEHPVWLPAYYLSQLPLFGVMRVWARYGIVVSFFIALLAGTGTDWILKQVMRFRSESKLAPLWQRLAPGVLLALIVVDFLPGRMDSIRVELRPIDRWIAEQEGDYSLAFIPNSADNNYAALYGSLTHEKRMPAYMHLPAPRAYERFAHLVESFPSVTALGGLRKLGLRYLIVQGAYYDGQEHPSLATIEAALAEIPRLERVGVVDSFVIYEFMR